MAGDGLCRPHFVGRVGNAAPETAPKTGPAAMATGVCVLCWQGVQHSLQREGRWGYSGAAALLRRSRQAPGGSEPRTTDSSQGCSSIRACKRTTDSSLLRTGGTNTHRHPKLLLHTGELPRVGGVPFWTFEGGGEDVQTCGVAQNSWSDGTERAGSQPALPTAQTLWRSWDKVPEGFCGEHRLTSPLLPPCPYSLEPHWGGRCSLP